MITRLKNKLTRLVRRNFALAFRLDYHRYCRRQDPAREPLIVFQMGKVGSSTLVNTLQRANIPQTVYQVHVLSDAWIRRVYHMYRDASRTYGSAVIDEHLLASRYLRDLLDRSADRTWKVITLIRDPVARNISAFFQAFPIHYPAVAKRFATERLPLADKVDELIELFLHHFDKHRVPVEWFDRHMQPVFGIDVYEQPFDTRSGYRIYRRPRVELLLIRLENLDRCIGAALTRFLDVGGITLQNANISEDKSYAQEYRLFQERVVLPRSYLDALYRTRYMRHFYSAGEIARFEARWTRAKTPQPPPLTHSAVHAA